MAKNAPEIVLGIDPGYDRFGWAIVAHDTRKHALVDCGCIETNRKATKLERYAHIQTELLHILTKYQPTIAGMEQLFFSRNVSTALPVAEVRGLAISCFLQHHVELREFNPGTIKSSVTGNGKADKIAMRKMVLLQLGTVDADLRQKVTKELDDTIDAIGVALTALRSPSSV